MGGWKGALAAVACVGVLAAGGCRDERTKGGRDHPESTGFGSGGLGGTKEAQNRGGVMGDTRQGATQNEGEVQGQVTSVGNRSLQVRTSEGAHEMVRLDERTQVLVGGQQMQGTQGIQEGSHVRATLRGTGDEAKAIRIEVLDTGTAPAPSFGSGTSDNQPSGSLGTSGQQGGRQR